MYHQTKKGPNWLTLRKNNCFFLNLFINFFLEHFKGQAIGICPKDRLFKGYIELEIELREFDRCRTLYEKYLEYNPQNCTTWIKYAELESILGDVERARAIYELGVEQPLLDMPEILWKSYIDFEIEQQEYDRTRGLYDRLLAKTNHVKVWLSLAQFELTNPENAESSATAARSVYKRAYDALKLANSSNEARMMVLEAWKDFEVFIFTILLLLVSKY